MLISYVSSSLTDYLVSINNLSKLEGIKIKYSIEVILNELSKIIFMAIIFIFFNVIETAFVVCITFLILRLITGGIHCKTYFKCLIVSTLFISSIIWCSNQILLSILQINFILIISCVVVYFIGPIQSNNRKYSESLVNELKHKSLIFLLIIFIISNIFSNCIVVNMIIWTTLFQTIQLIVSFIQKQKKFNQ